MVLRFTQAFFRRTGYFTGCFPVFNLVVMIAKILLDLRLEDIDKML